MNENLGKDDAVQRQQGQTLGLIYARSRNRCIGSGGAIPWRLPDDFAHFKQTTMGKPIIMGRKTYEDHESALPGRLNIVVTRQSEYRAAEGIVLAHSLEEALRIGWEASPLIFVIGGVEFFAATMPQADVVYETVVDADIDGDAILPAFDFSDWKSSTLFEHPVDGRHAHAFKVYRHERRGN